jgi:UPF0042 nucleotide-binding protein
MAITTAKHVQTIIVSGLSGSGKSTAIRALEDIGFFCIDNLPVVLLHQVIKLCERGDIVRIAVGIDVREREFLSDYESALEMLAEAGYDIETLYLTCDAEILIRRFKETRRRHPLQEDDSIRKGIDREKSILQVIRAGATRIIDTSEDNVHDLRKQVQDLYRSGDAAPFHVRLESFGFKYGLPREADYLFDVRFLPNPYFVEGLRELSGLDAEVTDYLLEQENTAELVTKLTDLLAFVLPLAEKEGKPGLNIAIGCTGGRHRSVAMAIFLAEKLNKGPYCVSVVHRHLEEG